MRLPSLVLHPGRETPSPPEGAQPAVAQSRPVKSAGPPPEGHHSLAECPRSKGILSRSEESDTSESTGTLAAVGAGSVGGSIVPKHEYGREGAYLQNEVLRRLALWVGLPMFAALMLLGLILNGLVPWFCLFPFLFLFPAMPAAMKHWERRADKAIDPYVTGFRGERDVADALRALGDDCYLVHDVDFGRGNVDHVAIAPAGIFTIETKAYAGSVRTDGDRLLIDGFNHTRELKQAFAEAMAVRDYLGRVSGGQKHHVTPLLVFTRGKVNSCGKCAGVFVLHVDRLAGFVEKGKPRLEPSQCSRIAAALSAKVSVSAAAR